MSMSLFLYRHGDDTRKVWIDGDAPAPQTHPINGKQYQLVDLTDDERGRLVVIETHLWYQQRPFEFTGPTLELSAHNNPFSLCLLRREDAAIFHQWLPDVNPAHQPPRELHRLFLDQFRYSPEHCRQLTWAQIFEILRARRPQPDLAAETAAGPAGGNSKPMRILFMAANPITTSRLDLEEELRSLELELRGVKHRDQITLTAHHAVRPDDLLRYVRAAQPTIIHFSGHGSAKGIVLRTDDDGYTEVSSQNLRRFLDGRGVDLLVLNACYSKTQADDVAGAVAAVVGTTSAVGDEAARRFTVAFYRSLGEGLSIREAFRDGGDAVAFHGLKDVFWSSGNLEHVPLGPGVR